MDSLDQIPDTLGELLSPIERTLRTCADGSGDIEDARQVCSSTTAVLEDVGEDMAARVVRTFGLLLEVADGLPPADGDDELHSDVHQFLEEGLQTLRDCLCSETEDSATAFSELLGEAQANWGEHLQLLSDDLDGCGSTDLVCEESIDEETFDTVETTHSEGQVDLILSALGPMDDSESPTPREQTEQPAAAEYSQTTTTNPFSTLSDAPDLDAELLEAYLEDATACLASMERAILEFENDPQSATPIVQLCRDLHTLKGASASVGLNALATQLHEVEDALEECDPQSQQVPMDLAMNCVDAVRAQIATLQAPKTSAASQPSASPIDEVADGNDSVRVRTDQLDRLMDLLADVVMWRSRRDERLTELDQADDEISRSLFRLQAIEQRHQPVVTAADQTADDRLGNVSDYVAEIVSDLREVGQSLRQTRGVLADENRAVSQFVLQFRQQLVQMKRVPLAGLFQRLHRSVRDAARAEDKEVRLEVHGETCGLERSLQEKLYEPLLHLVRNAVSHGIESPEARVAAGKPPVGTVTIDAYGSPHVLIIEIRDDGNGLDYDAIRRRGLERGLIFADRPVSNAELARLIFRPGFSTRDTAGEISGRGVGMNIVEETLNRCRCHIETESEAGCGTRFRLTIPLRSVIEHTLLFRVGGQSFGLPMQFVKSASQADGTAPSESTDSPCCRLAEFFGLADGENSNAAHWIDIADRLASNRADRPTGEQSDWQRLRLQVDDIIGPEEVVVRPLPPMLRRHPHLCGMTLSGAGDVVLLLDGRRLLNDASQDLTARPGQTHSAPASSDQHGKCANVLVVDDSLTARRKLVQKLRGYGFAITEAADGAQAVGLMKEQQFDAVFSDLEMPHRNGFELLAEMAEFGSAAPPCVIVTTRNEPDIEAQAMALGAAGFFAKPIDDRAVNDAVQKLGLTTLQTTTGDA